MRRPVSKARLPLTGRGEIRAMAGERTVCGEISIITARKANAPRIHGR